MCITIPGVLRQRKGGAGRVEIEGVSHTIDLRLLPEATPGDWLLVGLGAGLIVIDEDEALEIQHALRELSEVDLTAGMPASPTAAATPAGGTEVQDD